MEISVPVIKKSLIALLVGITITLVVIIAIINVGPVARALAFPLDYTFGLGALFIYALLYFQGVWLIFTKRFFVFKKFRNSLGVVLLLLGSLLILTAASTSDYYLISFAETEGKIAFVDAYRTKLNAFLGGESWWDATNGSLLKNELGGGLFGYLLISLCNSLFSYTNGLPLALGVFIVVIGWFVILFKPIYNKVKGIKETPKVMPISKALEDNIEPAPIKKNKKFEKVDNLDPVKSARFIDKNYQPEVLSFNRAEPSETQVANFNNQSTFKAIRNSSFTNPSAFRPAHFVRPGEAYPQNNPMNYETPTVKPDEPVLPKEEEIPLKNEQLTLDFTNKPTNEELVSVKPTFDTPKAVSSIPTAINSAEQSANPKPKIKWIAPSTDMLISYENSEDIDINNSVATERVELINATFQSFNVGAKCLDYVIGPSVTRYNIQYESNVSVRSVNNLVQDISVRLGGIEARFEGVVEGQKYSGLEVPNARVTTVGFKEVYNQLPDVKKHPLAVAFGKNIEGKVVYADFNDFPHCLVAGTTGSGKSVYIHSVITSLIMRNSPDDLRLVLIDPKKVEMVKYRDMPHLLCPIVNDAYKAKQIMSKLADEMNRRYDLFEEADGCTDIKEYNKWAEEMNKEKIPYIVAVIDEYADLVDTCKEIGQPVVSIAQKARAAGIHMLIATQRPSTNVITGVIKGNLPTRVALAVSSQVDSVTIIGEGGAEKLLGHGDMLVQSPLVSRVGCVRLQGCFINGQEIKFVLNYLKSHYPVNYNEDFLNLEEESSQAGNEFVNSPEFRSNADNNEEARYQDIKQWVMSHEYMSMSRIQRDCSVGFNRAGRFFKRLQDEGIVDTNVEGNKGCPVLVHDKFYDNGDEVVTSDEVTR